MPSIQSSQPPSMFQTQAQPLAPVVTQVSEKNLINNLHKLKIQELLVRASAKRGAEKEQRRRKNSGFNSQAAMGVSTLNSVD